tara:strand:+ start:9815 stop:10195 length:381 start_codon:yes stop_codon:yes gene_type:complete
MSETDSVTRGELSNAIETFFDRIVDYFPPPVFVGRGQSMLISLLISLVVLYVSLRPAMKMKENATTPIEEMIAIGIIVVCVIATLMVQKIVAGVLYNFAMYGMNRQHFANTHWVHEYKKARQVNLM